MPRQAVRRSGVRGENWAYRARIESDGDEGGRSREGERVASRVDAGWQRPDRAILEGRESASLLAWPGQPPRIVVTLG